MINIERKGKLVLDFSEDLNRVISDAKHREYAISEYISDRNKEFNEMYQMFKQLLISMYKEVFNGDDEYYHRYYYPRCQLVKDLMSLVRGNHYGGVKLYDPNTITRLIDIFNNDQSHPYWYKNKGYSYNIFYARKKDDD